jgi:membrane-bound serine protease (ClpP class)
LWRPPCRRCSTRSTAARRCRGTSRCTRQGRRDRAVSPGFFTSFLSTLIDPNIVSLLFLAGIVGLAFELFHPGIVIPGAFGAICMITALFGFSVLPLSWGGLALILLGIALLVIDLHVTSHGALTLSGLVAMAIGVSTLFNGAPSPYHTSVPLVVAVTVCLGGFWAFAMSRKALALRRKPAAIGPDDVVGMEGSSTPAAT